MTDDNLYELLYTSVTTPVFDEVDLQSIFEKSSKYNKEHGLTGMLIYYNSSFVQILEGPQEELMNVFKKISQDPRHSSIEIFYQGKISERSFENWSMAGKVLNDQDLIDLLPEFEPLDEEHLANHILNSNPSIGKALFLKLKEDLTA